MKNIVKNWVRYLTDVATTQTHHIHLPASPTP